MFLRAATTTLLVSLMLSACTVRPVQPLAKAPADLPTTPTLVAAQAEVEADLRAVLAAEVQARQAGDADALAALLDPAADRQWVARQRETLQLPITAIEVQRLFGSGDTAVAAVIETQAQANAAPLATYTYRTLRHTDAGWKLTSPTLAAWGDPVSMTVGTLTLTYRAFDEPYVRAMAPRLEVAVDQLVADFGLEDAVPPAWHITVAPVFPGDPPPSPQTPADLTIASPVTLGFPPAQVATPEQFLLGMTVDSLGLALLSYAFGAIAGEPGRLALGQTAVQWEVEQAVGVDSTADLRRTAQQDGPGRLPLPLATLLDPAQFTAEGHAYADRHLLLRFLVERYGRGVLAPYLAAVYTAASPEALIQSATGESLATVEAAWRAWMGQ